MTKQTQLKLNQLNCWDSLRSALVLRTKTNKNIKKNEVTMFNLFKRLRNKGYNLMQIIWKHLARLNSYGSLRFGVAFFFATQVFIVIFININYIWHTEGVFAALWTRYQSLPYMGSDFMLIRYLPKRQVDQLPPDVITTLLEDMRTEIWNFFMYWQNNIMLAMDVVVRLEIPNLFEYVLDNIMLIIEGMATSTDYYSEYYPSSLEIVNVVLSSSVESNTLIQVIQAFDSSYTVIITCVVLGSNIEILINPDFILTIKTIHHLDVKNILEIGPGFEMITILVTSDTMEIISMLSPSLDLAVFGSLFLLPRKSVLFKKFRKKMQFTSQNFHKFFQKSGLYGLAIENNPCFYAVIYAHFYHFKHVFYSNLFGRIPGSDGQTFCNMSPLFFLFVVTKRVKKKHVPTFTEEILAFYHIWPWHQWLFSLLGLIVSYWVIGMIYNWYLTDYGGWLSTKARIYMILVDIFLNMLLGFYYMHYRDTLMGALTLECPVAISPLIFAGEFFVVIIYYQWNEYKSTKNLKAEPKHRENGSGLTLTGAAIMAEDRMSPQMRAALKKRHKGPMGTFLPSTEPSKRWAKIRVKLVNIIYFIPYLFKKFIKWK